MLRGSTKLGAGAEHVTLPLLSLGVLQLTIGDETPALRKL